MRRNIVVCTLLSGLLISACSDDSVKKTSCDAAAYTPICLSDTTYQTCVNGIVVPVICSMGQKCVAGECKGTQTDVTTCTVEGATCEGSDSVICVGGVKSRTSCPFGCENGVCRTSAVSCSPDGNKCDGNIQVKCEQGIESRQECVNGCEGGVCKPSGETEKTCTTTGSVCEGNVVVMCIGGVESRKECEFGCENGMCKTEETGCSPDGKKCEGSSLVTCVAGIESRQTCANGCEDSACKTEVKTCEEEGVSCDGAYLVTCVGGVESRQLCESGCGEGQCLQKTEPKCGNNIVEGDEKCDGTDPGVMTCHDVKGSMDTAVYTGDPECNDTCDGVKGFGTCEMGFCRNNRLDINQHVEEFCDVVDGVDKFLNEPKCEDIPGYAGKTWQPGGRPGCSDDCKALKKGTCKLSAQPQCGIETCQFKAFNIDNENKEVSGELVLLPMAGADASTVEGQFACGIPESATYSWRYSDARFMECEDCESGEYKLVSELSYANKAAGTYGCVFRARVKVEGDKSTSFCNCPVEYGYPFQADIPDASVMKTFEVEAEKIEGTILAHWDFGNYTKDQLARSIKANDGVKASESKIKMSDDSEMRMLTGTEGYPKAAASSANWPTASTLGNLDTAKHFVISLSSTGYENIRFKFRVAGSGISEKPIVVAYRLGNMATIIGEEFRISSTNEFEDYPLTMIENVSNQSSFELNVYTYAASDQNMTIRLDDIYVIGDAI